MQCNDHGQTALEVAFETLNRINQDVLVLTSVDLIEEATGAENAWLDKASRAALMPADTREAAALKSKLLGGNLSGWAIQASRANGLVGAAALIMGALAAEAHEWGIDTTAADALDLGQPALVVTDIFAPDVLAAYRANAKPRRLGPALKRYKATVADVDAMLARRKDDELLADALHRSREALIDVLAISARNVAEIERKQRAYLAYRDRRGRSRWLFEHGVSVAFKIDCSLLELPAAEIERLKAKFPNISTLNDRPSDEEWGR